MQNSHSMIKLGVSLLIFSGVLILLLSQFKTAFTFMLPILIAALGFALSLGSAAGMALSHFPKQAGTASALIGLMQMSGAGVLVILTQVLPFNAPQFIAFHLLLLLPLWLILITRKADIYHPTTEVAK